MRAFAVKSFGEAPAIHDPPKCSKNFVAAASAAKPSSNSRPQLFPP